MAHHERRDGDKVDLSVIGSGNLGFADKFFTTKVK